MHLRPTYKHQKINKHTFLSVEPKSFFRKHMQYNNYNYNIPVNIIYIYIIIKY